MAFITMPDSLIQVGKAITRTLFKTYVKDNLDDLDSRVSSVEGAVSKIVIFDEIVINAATLESGGSVTGLDIFRVPSGFTLIDAKVYMFLKGSLTGTLQMDVQKSTSPNFSSSVSVFTTKPSITVNNYAVSSNSVFNGAAVVVEGDYLRLDITTLPSNGNISSFGVFLVGEAS